MVGVVLFAFYQHHAPASPFTRPDRIYPTFVVTELPMGLAGLVTSAIIAAAMANLSAALNSLSSTTMIDFYLRIRPKTSDRSRMRLSRAATIIWAIVLFGLAMASRQSKRVLETGLLKMIIPHRKLLSAILP